MPHLPRRIVTLDRGDERVSSLVIDLWHPGDSGSNVAGYCRKRDPVRQQAVEHSPGEEGGQGGTGEKAVDPGGVEDRATGVFELALVLSQVRGDARQRILRFGIWHVVRDGLQLGRVCICATDLISQGASHKQERRKGRLRRTTDVLEVVDEPLGVYRLRRRSGILSLLFFVAVEFAGKRVIRIHRLLSRALIVLRSALGRGAAGALRLAIVGSGGIVLLGAPGVVTVAKSVTVWWLDALWQRCGSCLVHDVLVWRPAIGVVIVPDRGMLGGREDE